MNQLKLKCITLAIGFLIGILIGTCTGVVLQEFVHDNKVIHDITRSIKSINTRDDLGNNY